MPPWLIQLLKKHGWSVVMAIIQALDMDRLVQRRNAIKRAKSTNDGALAPVLLEGKLRYVVFAGDDPVEAYPPVKGELPALLKEYNGYGKRRPDELPTSRAKRRLMAFKPWQRESTQDALDDDHGDGRTERKPDSAAFQAMTDKMPELLDELTAAASVRAGDHLDQPTTPGIYLLSEGPAFMYVGQTRNLRQRLRLHTAPGSKENQASFAFRLAQETAEQQGVTATGTRKERAAHPAFAELFQRSRARVAEMQVRTIEMEDPIQRTVFEVFAAQALNLYHNDFETH
jgi:hypothetical protein